MQQDITPTNWKAWLIWFSMAALIFLGVSVYFMLKKVNADNARLNGDSTTTAPRAIDFSD